MDKELINDWLDAHPHKARFLVGGILLAIIGAALLLLGILLLAVLSGQWSVVILFLFLSLPAIIYGLGMSVEG